MKKFIKIMPFIFMLASCSHHKSGARSKSKTIEDSKERGTFIQELDYKIVPDTIKLAPNTSFYLEKGFRYGDFSSSSLKENTEPLLSSDDYTCQIVKNPLSGEYFEGHFLIGRGGDKGLFHRMKDTIRSNIVTKVPQYDSIYKVGELLLFKKYQK
ncbi:hypothetical protein [uncultured Tenacibaculum sp.]|uniref:hypothetical protein n=1 Tax=uncultured Tenacibaculum sp. TaxID=174713 RepID=UPI00260C1129|nr:hypothetical protein [uncultured Tenacibaculum sp.]